jgi:prevent-host-death family protein
MITLARYWGRIAADRQETVDSSRSRQFLARLPDLGMYDKMSNMGESTVSVRELQQNLKRVMARVERGETVEVTRRRRPVARLAPVRPSGAVAPWPDLEARTRSVFGTRVIAPGGSDLVLEDRGVR